MEDNQFDRIEDKDKLRAVLTTILPALPALGERDGNVVNLSISTSPLPHNTLHSTPKAASRSYDESDSIICSSDLSEAENSLEISGINQAVPRYGRIIVFF